jgi:PD-(D/E)XK nuclease superfamily
MVPPGMRRQPHVSFTQIDQYLRCPLKYRFTYVDRLTPEFVPAALAFGSGIHGAAAFLFNGAAAGAPPALDEVQGYFESYWNLETEHKPIRFGEKDTKASLLDLAVRMLEVLYRNREPGTEIVGVEQPFDVPLIDLDTGEVLERALVGTLDLIERDAERRVVVVDLKTSARKYTDLKVDLSLQLSVYSYATAMNGLGDQRTCGSGSTCSPRAGSRSCADTGRSGTGPRACGCSGWRPRCCTRSRPRCSTRTWAGSAGTARSGASAGRGGRRAEPGKEMNATRHLLPRSGSRKVNGYVKAVLALEAVRRSARTGTRASCARSTCRRDELAAEVATRRQALSGGPLAAASGCWRRSRRQ